MRPPEIAEPSGSVPRTGYVELDGGLLRAALTRKGLTQGQLASATGVCEGTIRRMLRGLPVQKHKAAMVCRHVDRQPDSPEWTEVEAYLAGAAACA